MVKFFKNPKFIFIVFLSLISLFYNYQNIVFKRPESVHKWRQSDCASLALNYYQNGMHFFQPQTNNFTSDYNASGYTATSELPIIYYFVAILYKLFGYHDFIYRILNTLLFYLGLFYLFKLFYKAINNVFFAICGTLLFFASPVVVYYGNNFLTDSVALSLGLVAIYHFYVFHKEKSNKHFYYSIALFFLAGSCKITALLSFVGIGAIIVIDLLKITNIGLREPMVKNGKRFIIPVILLVCIILSWILFAKQYNFIHKTGYFSTSILPLWELDKAGIRDVLDAMWNLWLNQYFHQSTLIILGLILLFNLGFYKTKQKFLYFLNIFLFIGTILYSVLWFSTYKNHDYYLLNLYVLPIVTFVLFLSNVKQLFPQVLNSMYLKIVFVLFLFFNIYHTSRILRVRYEGWQADPAYHSFQTISPYLHSIGIKNQDTVICLPDYTHASLYNMNLKGWTNCMGASGDSLSFERNIKNGAKYIITNEDISSSFPFALKHMNNKIGDYQNISIYKIKK